MKVGLLVDIKDDYEASLRHAKELGFNSGQLVIWDMNFYTDENAEKLKKLLDEIEFTVTDLWCGWSGPVIWKYPDKYKVLGLVPKEYRAQRLEDLRKGGEFAYKLGIKNIISHTGYIPDDPAAEAHIGVVESLKILCSELLQRGQSFSFETGEELPLTLNIMINEIGLPNVGVNFDPSNLTTGGRANAVEAMELLGSKVVGMHAKDGIRPTFGSFGGKQVKIGTGHVDFETLLRQLKEFGYQGDIVIEHEMPTDDRDLDLINSKKYLEDLIKKVFD